MTDLLVIFVCFTVYGCLCTMFINWFDYSTRLKASCRLYEGAKDLLDASERETVERFLNKAAFKRGKKPPYPARGLGEPQVIVINNVREDRLQLPRVVDA